MSQGERLGLRIEWTDEMKTALTCCREEPFNLMGPATGKVMNTLYRKEFAASQRKLPIHHDSIGGTWRERARAGNHSWARVIAPPLAGTAGDARRAEIASTKATIANTIQQLGIPAQPFHNRYSTQYFTPRAANNIANTAANAPAQPSASAFPISMSATPSALPSVNPPAGFTPGSPASSSDASAGTPEYVSSPVNQTIQYCSNAHPTISAADQVGSQEAGKDDVNSTAATSSTQPANTHATFSSSTSSVSSNSASTNLNPTTALANNANRTTATATGTLTASFPATSTLPVAGSTPSALTGTALDAVATNANITHVATVGAANTEVNQMAVTVGARGCFGTKRKAETLDSGDDQQQVGDVFGRSRDTSEGAVDFHGYLLSYMFALHGSLFEDLTSHQRIFVYNSVQQKDNTITTEVLETRLYAALAIHEPDSIWAHVHQRLLTKAEYTDAMNAVAQILAVMDAYGISNRIEAGKAEAEGTSLPMHHGDGLSLIFRDEKLFLLGSDRFSQPTRSTLDLSGVPIDQQEPTHQHGGQIVRIAHGKHWKSLEVADIVLCDVRCCHECKTGNDQGHAGHLAYVHAIDLRVRRHAALFDPSEKTDLTEARPPTESYPIDVRFANFVVQKVMVCDQDKCVRCAPRFVLRARRLAQSKTDRAWYNGSRED